MDEESGPAGPFTPEEAAQQLGAGVAWLKANLYKLPHRRYGKRIVFEAEDIAEIRALQRHVPKPVPEVDPNRLTPLSRYKPRF